MSNGTEVLAAEVPLAAAAQRMGMTWHRAWARVLSGALRGRQDESGRWFVSAEDVDRLADQEAAKRAISVRPTRAAS